jgi:predicted ATPase
LGLLADSYRQIGQAAEALPLLSDALNRVEHTGERWFEAELHRLKAEALTAIALPAKAPAEAELSLRRALDVARMQDAKLWELRAAMSLARLWYGQGQRDEARDLFTSARGKLSDGVDMPDLRDATTLLDMLG